MGEELSRCHNGLARYKRHHGDVEHEAMACFGPALLCSHLASGERECLGGVRRIRL